MAVGLSMVAAVALDKQYAQALEAATIVVETVAAGLIAEDEAAREVATEYEAAAAEPVAMPSKWQQISALEQVRSRCPVSGEKLRPTAAACTPAHATAAAAAAAVACRCVCNRRCERRLRRRTLMSVSSWPAS